MERVRAGETHLLGILYQKYQKKLFGFFYRMSGQPAQSEDMVQTVFLRIMKYRHSFRGDGNFTQWMYHLARNVYADQFRKKRPLMFKEALASVDFHEDSAPNAAKKMETDEEISLLRRALAELPADKREIIVLSRFERLKYREIGDLLQMSEGAVKVKMFRALRELKENYVKLENGESYGTS